jgi:hypothetical protein
VANENDLLVTAFIEVAFDDGGNQFCERVGGICLRIGWFAVRKAAAGEIDG